MNVNDRSGIAEHYIFKLWEKKYFSALNLTTSNNFPVTIVSSGARNRDAGPDFKDAVIKIGERILRGDVEIHRAPEDWYQHGHHTDPAYNNVIVHLIIGKQANYEPAIRLNRTPVPAEIFVDIPDEKFPELVKKFDLMKDENEPVYCQLSEWADEQKMAVIEHFSRERFRDKVERFREMRQFSSWNQILYSGILEALGYAKNQMPFRKLAKKLPFEALLREKNRMDSQRCLIYLQGVLFGVAGLLPSQDPSEDWRKIKDQFARDYVTELESVWVDFSERLGLEPLKKEEWLFFRLRPANFPTRRIAGASMILFRFFETGILEKLLHLFQSQGKSNREIKNELVRLFICRTKGYWAKFYTFTDAAEMFNPDKEVTLIGESRSREIVINIVLPVLYAFALETEDAQTRAKIQQIYNEFPKTTKNMIERKMIERFFGQDRNKQKLITTAAKQQGLIHLYKLFCRRNECVQCLKSMGFLKEGK